MPLRSEARARGENRRIEYGEDEVRELFVVDGI